MYERKERGSPSPVTAHNELDYRKKLPGVGGAEEKR